MNHRYWHNPIETIKPIFSRSVRKLSDRNRKLGFRNPMLYFDNKMLVHEIKSSPNISNTVTIYMKTIRFLLCGIPIGKYPTSFNDNKTRLPMSEVLRFFHDISIDITIFSSFFLNMFASLPLLVTLET